MTHKTFTDTRNRQLALDTILRRPADGIPTGLLHIMEHSAIEHFAQARPGDYARDPHGVYVRMLQNIGVCMVDQYIATNPLAMDTAGFHGSHAPHEAVTLDGILIDSPEAVAEHIERFEIPRLREAARTFDAATCAADLVRGEEETQQRLGPSILKAGYWVIAFPTLSYWSYGYENYFAAFALWPELMRRHFEAQADCAVLRNRVAVDTFARMGYPPYCRLDHDMADSRGPLTGLAALEDLWFPAFERSIRPAVDAGFALVWHCDGNLMDMIPPLISCGVNGFQGFQYEDGMDYVKICAMKDRDGGDLLIQAGVSVTRELPFGTPSDVRKQVDFLVEHGPRTGLFLKFSSSCLPNTPLANIETAVAAMRHYRTTRRRF